MLALAEQGAKVVIDYVAQPDADEELERKIAGLGDTAVGVEADVSKVEDFQRMIDTAVSKFGRLDVMVNNAGIETRTSVLDTTEAQFEKVMAVNLKSAFFGTQLAAKQMIAQGGGGRIINMTSVHEDWPMPGNTAYCLSKGGMRMLTRTAGVELAPHNICVVGVGPGAVEHADQRPDHERPRGAGQAERRHPDRPHGRARGDRLGRRLPGLGRRPATSPPRRSSPTAASCRAAPGSDRPGVDRQPDRRLADLGRRRASDAAEVAGADACVSASSRPPCGTVSRAWKTWYAHAW